MKRVIVLAAPKAGPFLDADLIDQLNEALVDLHLKPEPARWLAPERAVEIAIEGDADPACAIIGLIGEIPIDHAVVAAEERRKKLLLADMDSTIITVECIDELADFAGIKAEISAITERAMRGELDFEGALRERVARLKGLPASVIDRVYEERIRLTKGAKTLLATMRAGGAEAYLVSGGFTVFTDKVAREAGFNAAYANRLEIENGVLTGKVIPPIVGAEAKLATLKAKREALALDPFQTMAIGDGANDLPMILKAGLGIAYHAKPKVAAEAAANIIHGDLTTALFYQGYAEHEFRDA
jgi:phosphoserine phosphatase